MRALLSAIVAGKHHLGHHPRTNDIGRRLVNLLREPTTFRCEAPRRAPLCLLLHHAGQASPCNQPSQSAGREEREGVALQNLSREDIIWDTTPAPTTPDADSSISFVSFLGVKRQDTLFGAFCSGQDSPRNQLSKSAGRERQESRALRNLSQEDVIGPCRERRHRTPTGQSQSELYHC